MLPSGAPGVAPKLDLNDFTTLVIALAADVALHESASAVRRYRSLTIGGANVSGAPASVPKNAGQQIDAIVELAAEGATEVRGLKFEFVSSWHELTVHWHDGSLERYRELGALASHWGGAGHRRSITINVAALADAIQDAFKGE
ncbi:hypothetical protein SM11_chr0243 [Sinorhizobium meliloti SM11]|uniref:Uncharacterized protein n=1 Tax=Sinorhizobium meliloti (strain SM11) TaxID=707241 RepID=F7X7T6_SINMM|nr:hypothetical protein [Sinorhizobium meliloti]AEH77526.1 hypothetical protein SM11_chr0243 [Sinorhizobium meliloti SM11]MDE4559589.1 hypothetical protein [Sinorhizobium meliloti SM11]